MARFFRMPAVAMLVAILVAATGAAPVMADPAEGEAMILPVDPVPLVVETAQGPKSFTIEIADSDRERSAGLMFREEMDDAHGMLFVFDDTRRVAFWMKNTPLPLDLLFVGEDGRVAAIMEGEPFSTAPISPDAQVRFVLELNAGTAHKAGIADGDRVRHPQIDRVAD